MKFEVKLAGKRLAAAAIVFLGVALALAGTIAKGTGAGPVNADTIAQTVDTEKDHVTAGELAQWILEKKRDYQLVDIRPQWQFDDYHIPTAMNIPLPGLFQDAGLKQLSREKKVVLYGFGAGHAAQAQLLLEMKGYRAYSVRDGVVEWWETVMTPSSIRSDPPNPSGYREMKKRREQFMGASSPVPASAQSAIPAVPAAQPAPQTAPSPANKLKLGRGCS